MQNALELDAINLTLSAISGPVDILKNINFVAKPGESIAIVGPSGSGKSSLISIAAGLERPSSGQVTLLGISLAGKSENQLAKVRRGRVALVFQSFHLLPTLSAYDNVRLPLEIAKLDQVDHRATEALNDVGLSDRVHHYPGQLSGGERQRVAVARALASDPDLIFADEPTGNLDQATGIGVADLLFASARKRNACLILVTHDRELAKRADRIVSMMDGYLK